MKSKSIKGKSNVEIQKPGGEYQPKVIVITNSLANKIEISVNDNGIPAHIKDKIFQPFFTTKPTGQGTGLGLSLSYDIISKAHGGEIHAESSEGECPPDGHSGTTFILKTPIH